MKKLPILIIITLTILCNQKAFAQADKTASILQNATKIEETTYDIKKRISFDQIALQVPYASKKILKPAELKKLDGLAIAQIDLVYSAYPKQNESYQNYLNKMRVKELGAICPRCLDVPVDQWRLIEQTDCPNRTTAKSLFHGFVITAGEPYLPPDFTDEIELTKLTRGDSTILKVIDRNREWKKMLVVTDLTGSMSPYTAQLLIWFKLNEKSQQIEHFVFFNDGDEKEDATKVIGKTGGIYDGKAQTFQEVTELATLTAKNGHGGDIPENNIEALLHGLNICQDCEDIIMIADNWSTPRDLNLLNKVNKPIKIILCGTEFGVNSIYLDLAHQTGGSVHTIEQDIVNLLEVNEGEEIRIGREVFTIKEGKFVRVKRI